MPVYLAFSLLFCPYPPDPLPLRGRGRIIVFLCKGLRPLHPRGWVESGTGGGREVAIPRRGLAPGGADAAGGGGMPSRGLTGWLPVYLAFSLLCCPYPPDPLPLRGRGRP